MLSVLLQGTLTSDPVRRTAANGTAFATATMRVTTENGESVLASVITFSESSVEALLALRSGDGAAIAGESSVNHWEKNGEHRVGLRVAAQRVLTIHEARRERRSRQQPEVAGRNQGPST